MASLLGVGIGAVRRVVKPRAGARGARGHPRRAAREAARGCARSARRDDGLAHHASRAHRHRRGRARGVPPRHTGARKVAHPARRSRRISAGHAAGRRGVPPTLFEDVVADLAARGAIRSVQGPGGVDLLGPAVEAAAAVLRGAPQPTRSVPPNARASVRAPTLTACRARPARRSSAAVRDGQVERAAIVRARHRGGRCGAFVPRGRRHARAERPFARARRRARSDIEPAAHHRAERASAALFESAGR